MKKYIAILLALVMCLGLAACGKAPVQQTHPQDEEVISEKNTEVEEFVTEEDEESETSVNYTPADWEYYVANGKCQSETMGRYYAASNRLYLAKYELFTNEFVEAPVITEEFLESLRAANAYHDLLEDIYYDVCFGDIRDVSVEEYVRMEYYYGDGDGWEPPALVELKYKEEWNPNYHVDKYYDGQWKTNFTKRYAEGTFEIDENYYVWAIWYDNIEVPQGQHDDDFDVVRSYHVKDPRKDAYVLIEGTETGYQLIHILPQEVS